MAEYTNNSGTDPGKKQTGAVRPHKIRRARLTLLIFIFILIVAGAAAFVVMLIGPKKAAEGQVQKRAVFGVNEITVEGVTRYSPEEIIEKSGFYVGESVISVNKKSAIKAIKSEFHYVLNVSVESPAFGHINIKIQEEIPVAVVHMNNDAWMVMSETGKGVEIVTAAAAMESGYIRVLTGKLAGTDINDSSTAPELVSPEAPAEIPAGTTVLPERQFSTFLLLNGFFKDNILSDVREINMLNMTDIRLNWRDQIDIWLGNDSALRNEMPVVIETLGKVIETHSENEHGRLDASSYSDSNPENDRLYFTPQHVLDSNANQS